MSPTIKIEPRGDELAPITLDIPGETYRELVFWRCLYSSVMARDLEAADVVRIALSSFLFDLRREQAKLLRMKSWLWFARAAERAAK